MTPGDADCLRHILNAIADIADFTKGGKAEFDGSRLIQEAVLRQLEVIGEAARRVTPATRSLRPSIPWRDVVDFRNRLIHGYFDVDLALVWDVVERDLPALKPQIETLLKELAP